MDRFECSNIKADKRLTGMTDCEHLVVGIIMYLLARNADNINVILQMKSVNYY